MRGTRSSLCLAAQAAILLVAVAVTGAATSSVSRQGGDEVDYYEVLGIAREGVTDQSVKAAYRKQALKHHPDKNKGDPDAAMRFTLVGSN
jgi:preprotein translocase subunit Sec63